MPRQKDVKRIAARTPLQQKQAAIEALRFKLPVAQYLELIQTAAFTGEMPVLNKQGTCIGKQEMNVKERVDLLKYLTNKSMPDRLPTPEQLGRDVVSDPLKITEQTLETMSDEQIRAIVYGEDELETAFDSPSETEGLEEAS